eukprot:GDKJ01003365.1.p1 GENE.GDKJ01003365.1~~GDKJ01003365.1.p1  ORF type:complete len:433 (-),score=97.17 GDKJ01003365.1:344-1642(-)
MGNSRMLTNINDLQPGWNNVEMKYGGYDRRFRLFKPKNYNESTPIAHLLLHGWNDHCDAFCSNNSGTPYRKSQQSRFDEVIDNEKGDGHLLICPCSLEDGGLLGRRGWNAGVCCQTYNVDDSDFVLETVRRTAKMVDNNYNYETSSLPFSEVHSSGFSNGAMLTTLISCQYPDLFDTVHLMNGMSGLAAGVEGHKLCEEHSKKRWEKLSSGEAVPLRKSKLHGSDLQDLFKFSTMRKNGRLDVAFPWIGNSVLGFVSVPTDDRFFREKQQCDGVKTAPAWKRLKPLYERDPVGWEVTYSRCKSDNPESGLLFAQYYHFYGTHNWHHQKPLPFESGWKELDDRMGAYGYDDSRAILEFIKEARHLNNLKKDGQLPPQIIPDEKDDEVVPEPPIDPFYFAAPGLTIEEVEAQLFGEEAEHADAEIPEEDVTVRF